MVHTEDWRPLKAKTYLILLVVCTIGAAETPKGNPHQRTPYAWQLRRTLDGAVVKHVNTAGTPTFSLDLCELWGENDRPDVHETAHFPYRSHGCDSLQDEKDLWHTQLYICPSSGPSECGGKEDFHCAAWGCETIAPWKKVDRELNFMWVVKKGAPRNCQTGKCNPIEVTPFNPQDKSWLGGKTWGFRLYVSGYDPGIRFTVQKAESSKPQNTVGPLWLVMVPVPEPPPRTPSPTSGTTPTQTSDEDSQDPPGWPRRDAILTSPFLSPLLDTLDAMFRLLNQTSPKLTIDSWLCLSPKPPYYVGLATQAPIGEGTKDILNLTLPTQIPESSQESPLPLLHPNCPWGLEPKLTLGDLQGTGTCLISKEGTLQSSPYKDNCNQTITIPHRGEGNLYKAPNGTWWACTSGLMPCAFSLVFQEDKNHICILTHILPQIYYYSGEGGRSHLGLDRIKRTPVLIPVLLGIGIAGSAAVGSAALIKGTQEFNTLSRQIDEDLSTLESSISHLETSLSSLAEVVLQNRRGLDLLPLKDGGLCMALGETCCFWANHFGIIKENLSNLRKRLQERDEARWAGTNWFEGLFNWSPWLTTLISSLIGPIALFLLALTFGPCLLRYISQLIASRAQDLKLPVLRTHYQPIDSEEYPEESMI
ncbi:endogenous retrovirus group S71 member 1 Env polyprotein-like [Rhynchocyon petersi]